MNDYQSFGSGVTYFRRYAISSMLGLVTDKDIDAAGVQAKPTLIDSGEIYKLKTYLSNAESISDVLTIWDNIEDSFKSDSTVKDLFSNRKKQLTK